MTNRTSFRMFLVPAIAGAFAFACANQVTPDPFEGRWVGTLDVGSDLLFMRAKFNRTGAGLDGTLDLHGTGRLTLANFRYTPTKLRFEVRRGDEAYPFTGKLSDGSIVGRLHRAGQRFNFRLRRVPEVDPELIRSFVGTYQAGSDWVRSIEDCVDSSGFHQLVYVDPRSGGRKALFPKSENTFFFGPGFLIPEPIEGIVTFLKGRDGQPLVVWDQDGLEVTVGRLRSRETEEPGPLAGSACNRRHHPLSG